MENWFINQMKEAETNKRQISEKTGIAYQRIHKIANNPELLKTTGYENVRKIARALHMTIEQINARLKLTDPIFDTFQDVGTASQVVTANKKED